MMGATDGATAAVMGGESATGQGERSARFCKRLRIAALEGGIDSHGLELFTFDSTTGEGSQ